ncbi:YibE/F family protein [Butyricicoccus sp.]|uniref:YibE/F family protein n=1 Tax=Butyricicoccus sp. TaxID=2049021 RepID=UPI003F18057F
MGRKTDKIHGIWKRLAVVVAAILTAYCFYTIAQVERQPLMENEGRSFVKAEVVSVLQDNEQLEGVYVGDQRVQLRILTGAHAEETVEAISSSSYLYGAHCKEGMKVVAILSESQGEIVASVYGYNREPMLYLIIGLFLLTIWLIGGRQGLYSILGLAFTFVCIFCFFLPMIYRGFSPVAAAILVVIASTLVTMYLVAGVSVKATAAVIGTVMGVLVAGILAFLFGKLCHVTGYNVSDIENLIYVQEQVGIEVGELLFAGILIAALGAVMDVSMSISSTLQEIHDKNPGLTGRQLFHSGMTVGKDMMGTMSNTLILAFAGGSVNTLVLFYAYAYSYTQVINMYDIAIEIMQGISASLGVVLTVPFVSAVAAWMISRTADSTCRDSRKPQDGNLI